MLEQIEVLHSFLLTLSIFSLMLWLISTISLRKNSYDMKRRTTALLFAIAMLFTLNLVMFKIISTNGGYGIVMALAVAYGVDHFYFDPRVYHAIAMRIAEDISEYKKGEKVQNEGESNTPE